MTQIYVRLVVNRFSYYIWDLHIFAALKHDWIIQTLNYYQQSVIWTYNVAKRRKKSFVFGGIKTYKDLIFWEYHIWFSYLYAVSVTTISGICYKHVAHVSNMLTLFP